MTKVSNSSSAHCGRWFRGKISPAGGDRQWIELRASKAAELGRPDFRAALFFFVRPLHLHFLVLQFLGGIPISPTGGREAPKRRRPPLHLRGGQTKLL